MGNQDQRVTCVMITGKSVDRKPFAAAAIRSFELQTYKPKELVIVNDGDGSTLFKPAELPLDVQQHGRAEILEWYRNQRDYSTLIADDHVFTLGDLRNFAFSVAEGRWVCQWDDDDWSSSQRLHLQMGCRKPGTAVLLRSQVRYSFTKNAAIAVTFKPPGLPGTVLHDIRGCGHYPSIGRHEDSRFLNTRFAAPGQLVEFDNRSFPQLYLRFFTGHNTWDEAHVMRAATVPNRWSLSRSAADYLACILRDNYAFMNPDLDAIRRSLTP